MICLSCVTHFNGNLLRNQFHQDVLQKNHNEILEMTYIVYLDIFFNLNILYIVYMSREFQHILFSVVPRFQL